MFTYFYILILADDYIYLDPYICACLHISTPIYQRIFTYFNNHIPAQLYILLHTYTSICLYISAPVYLRMFTYAYTRNPMQAYVLLHRIPMHVYILIQPHISACSYTSAPVYLQVYIFQQPCTCEGIQIFTPAYLCMCTKFYTGIPMRDYIHLHPYSFCIFTYFYTNSYACLTFHKLAHVYY
jgi:hypothetical protein